MPARCRGRVNEWGATGGLTAIERSRIALGVELKTEPGRETVPNSAAGTTHAHPGRMVA